MTGKFRFQSQSYWMAPRRGQDVIPMSQIAMQRNISLVTNGTSTGTRTLTEMA